MGARQGMNDNSLSHGLWAATAAAPPPRTRLTNDIVANVVIVGGGFTGCSAAYHLADAGQTPVILEAEDIGFGGAGRNVGLVNAGMWVMPDDLVASLAAPYGERLVTQLGKAPQLVFDLVERLGIDCEAVRRGTLHCAVGRKGRDEIAARARQWLSRDADVRLLDAGEAARFTGSRAYAGALLDRRAGTIQPLAYVRGLAGHAVRQGARIFTQSPVIACEDLGSAWRVSTPSGRVVAKWVITTTDAYSCGPFTAIRREQVMLPYFQIATPPLAPELLETILPERQGAWDTRSILSSFRLDARGRLIFGSVGALRGPGRSIHTNWARREIARLFPQLAGVEPEHRWYGRIGMTGDAVPRLHLHGRNMVSVGGYNGRGIAPGTVFGRDLARLAFGEIGIEDFSLPLTDLRIAPFGTSRAAFYEAGAQLAHFTGSRFHKPSHRGS